MIATNHHKKGGVAIWVSVAIALVLLLLVPGVAIGTALAFVQRQTGAQSSGESSCQDFGNNCRLIPPEGACSKKETRVISTVTRYYRPLPGQQKYNMGSYEAEKRMEGDLATATGINVGIGAIAVEDNPNNSNYIPYGTVITVPGYGTGVAVDRGSAIRGSHLDLWVGEGDEGRENANKTDNNVTVELCFHDELKNSGDVRKAVGRVCDNNAGNNCTSANTAAGELDFRNIGPSFDRNATVGKWQNVNEVISEFGGPAKIANDIVRIKWMGINVSVHKSIVSAMEKVEADIKASGTNYNIRQADTAGYNVRENVNTPGAVSPHATGLAIDVNWKTNPNTKRKPDCAPRDPTCCPKDIPKAISDAFEKNGFFWGAKFGMPKPDNPYGICDPMHFMYGGNWN